jgi:hypothetical protein
MLKVLTLKVLTLDHGRLVSLISSLLDAVSINSLMSGPIVLSDQFSDGADNLNGAKRSPN